MSMNVGLTVNGERKEVAVRPMAPLSELLREGLELTGTKRGCETGKCGACTVLVDGKATKSCQRLAGQAEGCEVVTIEGLADHAGDDGDLHPVQQGFIEKFGMQCGYCTPGMAMTAVSLLEENPNPTREEIQDGVKGNLCRCTGYTKIYDSVRYAAERLEETTVESARGDD
ncbi:(2Fe-2S)-binding protein [Salinigranum salinum]|uniref:(2Fe-2S)-binding protein n=1 Tax=Salinigranum salinum TaxID=1364937 RepID=UPI0012609D46|nr:(2Fe-2S)-binding protein [Salinigranum salinum]